MFWIWIKTLAFFLTPSCSWFALNFVKLVASMAAFAAVWKNSLSLSPRICHRSNPLPYILISDTRLSLVCSAFCQISLFRSAAFMVALAAFVGFPVWKDSFGINRTNHWEWHSDSWSSMVWSTFCILPSNLFVLIQYSYGCAGCIHRILSVERFIQLVSAYLSSYLSILLQHTFFHPLKICKYISIDSVNLPLPLGFTPPCILKAK